MDNVEKIISDNKVRYEKLMTPFDPETGFGSHIDRTPVHIDKDTTWYMPDYSLHAIPILAIKDFEKWYNERKYEKEQAVAYLQHLRYMFDFEYYAYKQLTIKDKVTSTDIPFILNHPQLKINKVVQDTLFANKPVRVDILKARKWGGSTYVAMLFPLLLS